MMSNAPLRAEEGAEGADGGGSDKTFACYFIY